MKSVKEVGLAKSFKFVLYTFLEVVYKILILPPIRIFFLKILGAKIGNNSTLLKVNFFNWHHKGISGLTVGNDCFIGDEALIDLYEKVTLEDQVTIAQKVLILTHLNVGFRDHPLQKQFPKSAKPVIIKKGAVIAAGATILPGTVIGEKSFIAAGSVVTKSVPSKCLYAGNPAKLIRKIAK